jgi:hypothetical protein
MKLKNHQIIIIVLMIVFLIISFPLIHDLVLIYFDHVDMDDVKYDNSFVIGSTYDEIVEKYGEFDAQWGNFKTDRTECCYMVRERRLNGQPFYYYVVFDENKVAYKTFLAGPKGG